MQISPLRRALKQKWISNKLPILIRIAGRCCSRRAVHPTQWNLKHFKINNFQQKKDLALFPIMGYLIRRRKNFYPLIDVFL